MDAWLIMRTERGRERPFQLAEGRATIGRSTRCDIRISLPNVAERQCEIHFDGKALRLRDLTNTQAALVNGQSVTEANLKSDDHVQIGPVEFVVRCSAASRADEVTGQDADSHGSHAMKAIASAIDQNLPDALPPPRSAAG
ncbi:MAG: FHA domain-containing protein [Phycisphaerales bacterium]|nr:MAG: FHA domain-containing protein [Phycisphaerales bacterium]